MGERLFVFGCFAALMIISKTAGPAWALGILAVPVAIQLGHLIIRGHWIDWEP